LQVIARAIADVFSRAWGRVGFPLIVNLFITSPRKFVVGRQTFMVNIQCAVDVIVLPGNPEVTFVQVNPASIDLKTELLEVANIIEGFDWLIAICLTAVEPLTFAEIAVQFAPLSVDR